MLKKLAWKYFCQFCHGVVMFTVGAGLLLPMCLFPPVGFFVIPAFFVGIVAMSLLLHGLLKTPYAAFMLLATGARAIYQKISPEVTHTLGEQSGISVHTNTEQSGLMNELSPPYQPVNKGSPALFSSAAEPVSSTGFVVPPRCPI